MKVTILGSGTSQGVPMIGCTCEVCSSLDFRDKRLRSSVMIEVSGQVIVIDTGPDFRQQMLREGVRKLDAVLFTHSHKDHIAGLDDVRAFNFFQKSDVPIFGTEETLSRVKEEFYYAFEENPYPGVPRLNSKVITKEPFGINRIPIIPIEVWHHLLPILGFRIGDFTYITDAKRIPESEWHKLEGTKVLVLNALQREPHISHFTLEEALELIKTLKIPKAFLTHIGHRMGRHAVMEEELPENVRPAFDGLTITF